MRHVGLLVIAGTALALSGCETMGTAAQSKTVQGGATGAALGAATGAIIGHQTGRGGEGAAVGAALGGLGGAMMGRALEEQEKRLQGQQLPAAGRTKFCPVGGELYPEDVKYCPNHGVELRYKEQP